MELLKQRKVQIAGVLVVLLLVGGYFLFFAKSKSASNVTAQQDQVIQKLSNEELGLKLSISPNKEQVKFLISKATGIKSIEYQLTYEADSTADEIAQGGDARVQRGITGSSSVDSSKDSFDSGWLDLGSCSKNVCRYDKGVSSVNLTLKIVKNDGKTYQAESSLNF